MFLFSTLDERFRCALRQSKQGTEFRHGAIMPNTSFHFSQDLKCTHLLSAKIQHGHWQQATTSSDQFMFSTQRLKSRLNAKQIAVATETCDRMCRSTVHCRAWTLQVANDEVGGMLAGACCKDKSQSPANEHHIANLYLTPQLPHPQV